MKKRYKKNRKSSPRSEETKKKISEKLKGHSFLPETIDKMRQAKLKNPTRFWKGKKIPKEAIMKMVIKKLEIAPRGKDHYNWKGGITSENRRIRTSFEYKNWRRAVFERDKYTCIWCGTKSGNGKAVVLNADHIKPFALFPELRFAIDNGRTLCTPCHKTTETFGGKSRK